jgi:hypothetical protein
MSKTKLGKKQEALLLAAKYCAHVYMDAVIERPNPKETREHAFMAGYIKAMKDCGFDVTDEESLEGITIVWRSNEQNT